MIKKLKLIRVSYAITLALSGLFFLFSACKREKPQPIVQKNNVTVVAAAAVDTLLQLKGPFDNTLEPKLLAIYANKTSYKPGDTISFYSSFDVSGKILASLPIRDLQGNVVDSIKGYAYKQTISNNEPYTKGYGYQVSIAHVVPANLKSGVYIIGEQPNFLPIVIRRAANLSNPAIVVIYPSNTDEAYNDLGGKSQYIGPRVDTVSFLRPLSTNAGTGPGVADGDTPDNTGVVTGSTTPVQYFSYGFLKWLPNQGYDVSYISDMDLDDYKNIAGAKLIIVPGHSEYWTRAARVNFDAFVAAGNNALVLSGDTMWWQVRYSNDHSQMICYKLTPDPISTPSLRTNNWDNVNLKYPISSSIGGDHNLGGNGLSILKLYGHPGFLGFKILNSASPLLKNTNLKNGDILSVPTDEYDGTYVIASTETNNFVEPDMSKTNFQNLEIVGFDYGTNGTTVPYTVATFIVFKKTASSGYVVNTSSTDWCSVRGFGGKNSGQVIQITKNSIDDLISGVNPL